jgi:hypothetical protein
MTPKSHLTKRIAPQGIWNMLAGLLAILGFGLILGPTMVNESLDQTVRVAALGLGGTLLFVGGLWDAQLRYAAGSVDERMAQIYYRSAWVALLGLITITFTLTIGLSNDIVSLSPRAVLHTVTGLVFGIFFAAQWIYRWLM